MGITDIISYPPDEIISPPPFSKKRFDQIILWMLNYNEELEWSHFTNDPVNISQSTLSNWLNRLMDGGYIMKVSKKKNERICNVYKITSKGKERLFELSRKKDEVESKLNYPPRLIINKRNYEHCILWMLYNNNSCRWSDFKDEPLSINQSSLSNSLNSLIESGYIQKNNNKDYVITSLGETEYLKILKSYDLDRQSLLEEESKRIEQITRETIDFFKAYQIKDDDVKFRFLNNIIKLDYAKVKTMVEDKEEFYKILLFLSMNHPDQYPKYISIEQFSSEYDIDINTLKFFIQKIVDQDLYDTKFFKLDVFPSKELYFQENEKLERMLRASVDEKITKFTYLNKLSEFVSDKPSSIDISSIINKIVSEGCVILFHEDLKDAFLRFLPQYIKDLAYKIGTEKKLVTDESKLESLIWQAISTEFEAFSIRPSESQEKEGEVSYVLNNEFFETLNIFYLYKLDFIEYIESYDEISPSNLELLDEFVQILRKGDFSDVLSLFNNRQDKLNEIEKLIFQDLIYTSQFRFQESIEITDKLIEKRPKDYLGYLFQSITYFLMNDLEKSLDIIEQGIKNAYNFVLIAQKTQILIRKDEEEEGQKIIEKAISKNPNNVLLLRTKFSAMVKQVEFCQKNFEKPVNLIETAIKLKPMNKDLIILKAALFSLNSKFKDAENIIKDELNFAINPFEPNPLIDTSALLLLAHSYIGRGRFGDALKVANQCLATYPNNPISFVINALVFGYSLIYNGNLEGVTLDDFNTEIDKALIDPLKFNRAMYYQLKAIILNQIGKHQDAIDAIDEAIKLNDRDIDYYKSKVIFMIAMNRDNEAIRLIDLIIENFPKHLLKMNLLKSFIYFKIKDYNSGLNAIDEVLAEDPNNKPLQNNKALILVKLNRLEEALETIEKLIEIDPEEGNSYDTYGEILMELKRYESAIEKFEKAIEINPSGWYIFETYRKMGECYKNLGNTEEAKKCFKKMNEVKGKTLPLIKDMYN
ncbi:MAG: tetratricopeptide repeat protein [Promethearchaeota archaeon]